MSWSTLPAPRPTVLVDDTDLWHGSIVATLGAALPGFALSQALFT